MGEMLLDLIRSGVRIRDAARALGVGVRRWHEYARENPDFRAELEAARRVAPWAYWRAAAVGALRAGVARGTPYFFRAVTQTFATGDGKKVENIVDPESRESEGAQRVSLAGMMMRYAAARKKLGPSAIVADPDAAALATLADAAPGGAEPEAKA